jgi:hypothetical protein
MKVACAALLVTALALTIAAAEPAAPPASPYEPLAFLVGHCWKGTFPGSPVTDEHCFSWVYGDKFVRDQHVVHHGDGRPDDLGESLYLWDASAQELQYLYIESAGGFSRGTVTSEAGTLVFPPARYTENGAQQLYRSRWRRLGPDAYEVVTEFQVKGVWTPRLRVQMQQVAASSTR